MLYLLFVLFPNLPSSGCCTATLQVTQDNQHKLQDTQDNQHELQVTQDNQLKLQDTQDNQHKLQVTQDNQHKLQVYTSCIRPLTQVTSYTRHSRCQLHMALKSSHKSYNTLKLQVTKGPLLKSQVIQYTQVASY